MSEEVIIPRDVNNPFNAQTLPTSTSGLSNKPNANEATMYVGAFQIVAMPMTRAGFPSTETLGNNPNMFGNKNQ